LKKIVLTVVGLLVVAVGFVGYSGWYHLLREVPNPMNGAADPVERFYFDTIGAEVGSGMPKYVYEVLPEMCPDLLPGGYASMGFVYTKGHDIPVGYGEKTIGFPRLSFNCASCHHGTVRASAEAEPVIIPAMPPSRLDYQRYAHFLWDCVVSERFSVDKAMAAIEKRHQLGFMEKQFYKFVILPKTHDYLVALKKDNEWHATRQPFGPGRYDCMETIRKSFGGDPTQDDATGVVDLPPLWNQIAQKKGYGMYDGCSGDLGERNRTAAWLAGAPPEHLDKAEMTWIEKWLSDLRPPKYPFPVDEGLATKGQAVFQANCAGCHLGRVGELMTLEEIGTDRARTDSFTTETIANISKRLDYKHYIKTQAYRIPALDGTWSTAPFLHNGSVPTMRALLLPPAQRPKAFYRGYDVYDPKDLGFVSTGSEASKHGKLLDTQFKGNGNQGHDYGTQLDEESKNALIEFLKKV
jgi:hypothetical protein